MICSLPCVLTLRPVQNNFSEITEVTEVSVALFSATRCAFPERLYVQNVSEGVSVGLKFSLTFGSGNKECYMLFYCGGQNDGFCIHLFYEQPHQDKIIHLLRNLAPGC